LALLAASPALAQTTNGQLRGSVVDSVDGLPIPGVTVSISSPNLIGGTQQRTTDGNGGFQFVELPPGAYDVTATKAGFRSVTTTNVAIEVGRTRTVTIELPVSSGNEEVIEVVSGRKAVDVEDTSRGE